MPFDSLALEHALSKLDIDVFQAQYAVALSGGADSMALLIALSDLVPRERVLALHFDHQIHPDSDSWRMHCHTTCNDLGIAFEYGVWDGERPTQPSEADARAARYQWFCRILPVSHILLTGHHGDDQAETVLMGLAEGRNLDRVAGIPRKRSLAYGDQRNVVRPLLEFRHVDFCAYLRHRQVEWIEDPANESSQHARTLVRQTVIPTLAQRWPNVKSAISRVATDLTEALKVIDEAADTVINDSAQPERRTLFCQSDPLDILPLCSLSLARFKTVIRRWVHLGGSTSPSDSQLVELKRQLEKVNSESHCQIDCGSVEIQYFDQRLYLIVKIPTQHEIDISAGPDSQRIQSWLSVRFQESDIGISHHTLNAKNLKWQSRNGEHRFSTSKASGSSSLKKIMQSKKLAPWMRKSLPVLVIGHDVVWAHGLGVNARYQESERGESVVIPAFTVSL